MPLARKQTAPERPHSRKEATCTLWRDETVDSSLVQQERSEATAVSSRDLPPTRGIWNPQCVVALLRCWFQK
ncbi:hypothetical protein E2C01_007035 [Portunus trituberculatus]|uniref:Uncharacterized protein n=1 Tax=Portunus trituberculatus TaxID=210409 RepID=A0A5B7CX16_PORTR|nr:hypothetical protein [Portunus trituberculatus]